MLEALSLPETLDLNSFDPIFDIREGNNSNGVQVHAEAVKMNNFISQAISLFSPLSSASAQEISGKLFTSIANHIQAGNSLDLASSEQLVGLLIDASELIGAGIQEFATGTATIMADGNQRIDLIIESEALSDIEVEIAKVQRVVLDQTAADLAAVASGTKTIIEAIAENTGTALDEEINNAQVFDYGINNDSPSTEEALFEFSVDGVVKKTQELVAISSQGEQVLLSILSDASGLPSGFEEIDLFAYLDDGYLESDVTFELRAIDSSGNIELILDNLTENSFSLTGGGLTVTAQKITEGDIIPSLTETLEINGETLEGIDLQSLAVNTENIDTDNILSVEVDATLYREAAFDNLIGFYMADRTTGDVIDPLSGVVKGILTESKDDYLQAVREYSVVSGQVDNHQTGSLSDSVFEFNPDLNLSNYVLLPFLLADGSQMYVAGVGSNPDNSDHIRLLGNNVFGFEDLPGGGDNDFDDVIVQVHGLQA